MKDTFIIEQAGGASGIRLVSIRPEDAENLRQWKNAHREYFFHKEVISKDAQAVWMERYFNDADNFMFIVEYLGSAVGCMGFKRQPDGADIYNVILASKDLARKGIMSQAIKLMCGFIIQLDIDRIYLKVLVSNTGAHGWYEKNDFRKIKQADDAFLMEFYGACRAPLKITGAKTGAFQ